MTSAVKQGVEIFLEAVELEIEKSLKGHEPSSLYDPLQYFLRIGGKRIRPVLLGLSYTSFSKEMSHAIPAAAAIELFHNFTLIHDDIMDNSPLRRGEKTVHEKWSVNTAILSGDVVFIKAYQLLDKCSIDYRLRVYESFNQMAELVCKGQQLDMDFEKQLDVSLSEYLNMIKLKTAVLLGCAMEIGGILSGQDETVNKRLYKAGISAGLSFQMQDDFLDVFGDSEKFGKEIGGDIKARKKTFLYLKTMELAEETDKIELAKIYQKNGSNVVNETIKLYEKYNIKELTTISSDSHIKDCLNELKALENEGCCDSSQLREFIETLYQRLR